MRLPVDAHALMWYVGTSINITCSARLSCCHDDPSNDLLLSAGSIWGIGIQCWCYAGATHGNLPAGGLGSLEDQLENINHRSRASWHDARPARKTQRL